MAFQIDFLCESHVTSHVVVESQAAPEIDSWVNSTWNPRAEVSLDKFLVPAMDDQGKKRLAVLGNVVVPPQASMGAAVLFRLAGLERCSD